MHKVWLFLAFTLAACSSDQGDRDTASDFKVALLTPGPISDQSWNGGAYEGLMWIRDSQGADVSHIQTRTPAEFDENFRQYGAQRYDLIFGHGFEFQDAALRTGLQFPRTILHHDVGHHHRKECRGDRIRL